MSRCAPLLGATGLALASMACGPAARPAPALAATSLLVTVAPPGAVADDPVVDVPAGARLLRVDPARPDAPPLDLGVGLVAAGAPALSHDATRVTFVGRARADAPWTVYACGIDGTERRTVAATGADCASPTWLPDGRVAYASVVEGAAPFPPLRRAWALFVASADLHATERITFGAGVDIDPATLADGRLVYASWRPPLDGEPEGGRFTVATVHPDGSGAALHHGLASDPRVLRRPRPAADGTVVCTGGDGVAPDRTLVLDARWPQGEARTLPGLPPVAPSIRLPAGLGTVVAATEVVVRPRPQGHLSFVDPRETWGQLLGLDARFPSTPTAARVRVRRYAPAGTSADAPLGEAPLAADGSFFLRVPPDVPLLVDVLDAAGTPLSRSTTPIWVRPRETRGCVGCHEAGDVSPPNRRPAAIASDALDWSKPPVEVAR